MMKTFVVNRLDTFTVGFFNPLPRLKFNTFANTRTAIKISAAAEQAQEINADRVLLSRLTVVAQSRNIDLKI